MIRKMNNEKCKACKEEAKKKGSHVDCEQCKLKDYIVLDIIR